MSDINFYTHFPALFKDMRYGGVSTGDGWNGILMNLFTKMVSLPNPPLILQVKEKFGGLRVYTSRIEPQVDQWIREAEAKASETCELCGQPGESQEHRLDQDALLALRRKATS